MPYFKCAPCKLRVSTDGGTCPECGLSLEPVAKLTEVLGYRRHDLFDPSVLPRVAQRVADISGGRTAAQAQLDSDRWLEEGGSLAHEMLAEAVALRRPTKPYGRA